MAGFAGDNQLGPRVLGGPYKPPPEIPSSLVKAMKARITRVEKSYIPDPEEHIEIFEPPAPPGDHIKIDRNDNAQVIGFTVFLDLEGKSIFMPLEEAKEGIPFLDARLLFQQPHEFLKKYRNAMIVAARKALESGELGTQEEMDDYMADDWLTPEQRQVLRDL